MNKQDKLGIKDQTSIRVIRNKGGEDHFPSDELLLRGILGIAHIRDNKVIGGHVQRNTVNSGVLNYLQSRMDSVSSDKALDNLFTSGEVSPGSTMDAFDGIIVLTTGGSTFSTVTTSVSASNTHGRKWRGEITFSGSYSVDEARIGFNYDNWGGSVFFDSRYAVQTFTQYDVESNDKLILNWELYF